MSTTPEEQYLPEAYGRKPSEARRIEAVLAFGNLEKIFNNALAHKKHLLSTAMALGAGPLALAACACQPPITAPDARETPVNLRIGPDVHTLPKEALQGEGTLDLSTSMVLYSQVFENFKDPQAPHIEQIAQSVRRAPVGEAQLDIDSSILNSITYYQNLTAERDGERFHTEVGITPFGSEGRILVTFINPDGTARFYICSGTREGNKYIVSYMNINKDLNNATPTPTNARFMTIEEDEGKMRVRMNDPVTGDDLIYELIYPQNTPQPSPTATVEERISWLFGQMPASISIVGVAHAEAPPATNTPTEEPTPTSTPSPTSTPTPTETPTPTVTKEPTPTKTPLPRYINEGQWNSLTPEQQDFAINQWAARLSRDQAIRDAQVLEKALPYLKMFAHEQNYPMDPDVSNIVDQIIAERGSLPWAVDWRSQDYERGFLYVRTMNNGRTQAASNIDAFIQITSSGIYLTGSFPSHCSPEAQRLITNLEFAGSIIKEGGGSRLLWYIGRVRGQTVAQVDEYLFTTPGTMGIVEAITKPLNISFWTWVKNNVGKITSDPNVQQEIIRYANEIITLQAKGLADRNIDFNPAFP